MKSSNKLIATLVLTVFLVSNIFATGGEDALILHSLDELPSELHSVDELPSSQIGTSEEIDQIISKILDIPEEEKQSLSLIAARESFEFNEGIKNNNGITPSFIVNPFGSQLVPMDILLQNIREEALTSSFIGEEIALSLEGKFGGRIKTDKKTRINKQVSRVRGNIQAELPLDTYIQTNKGEILNGSHIGIYESTGTAITKGNTYFEKKQKKTTNKRKGKNTIDVQGFEFGIPGKHLIFSKPVKISIDTPNMTNGVEMEIAVLHEGDSDYNTIGLSTSPDALCNSDGSSTIPGTLTTVQGGQATFYTCGASRFIINPTGGTTGSNDLKLIIGDCGQFQLYYNSGANVYTGVPPTTGCNTTVDSWIALRIGTRTYGSDWTGWSTQTTTGTTVGNTYTGRTTLTRVVGGRTYTVLLDWTYISPNKFFNIDWSVTVPTGNTNNIRFYIANDSTVGGADANDVGYTGSAPSQTVGVYDSVLDQMSAIRYLSGVMWTAQQANGYNTVRTQINNGADFTNAIQTTVGDLGFGVNWNFGTTPGTRTGSLEWRMLPFSTGSYVDLVPGIGQPEGPLTVNYLSQIPVTITNAGSISSSGNHVATLIIPTNITGPASAFSDNGWSCSAQIGTTVTCNKTTTIASLATDTLRIPVVPLLAASGSMVTFTGTISNSGDTVPANNSAFATNAVVSATVTSNPGGVTGAGLWLRADNGTNCSTSGCTITTWTNRGLIGTGADAITGSGVVIYSSGSLINGNPTIYFNNASLNTLSNLAITSTFSIFTVSKLGINGKFPIGTQTGVTNALDWMTTPTYDSFKLYGGATSYSGANSRTANVGAITSSTRSSTGAANSRTNGLSSLNGTLATAITASRIRMGGTANTSGSLAHVSEIIIFNTQITGANLNKVESYLATKYGITLNQSSPTNYTLSNNSIGMNGTVMAGYVNNITGIARDDNSSLNQRNSQSHTNSGDIRVSIGAIGTNYSALYWGNNGGATGSLVTTDIPLGSSRITREWRFEENNSNIGSVTVSYPASSLPAGFTGTLMLFRDGDGVFASGSTYHTGTLTTGLWQFTLDITDGEYITFGKIPNPDTQSPTILSNSIASGSLLPIGNFSLTIGYSDTGSLVNASSFSGRIYSWNTGSSTWNVTNIAPTYMSISGIPTTSTGLLNISNLPFGKYRFDIVIADNAGNVTTQSYTYFVDRVDWTIDSDVYNIGNIVSNTTIFGTGELVITVQTVGAGFSLSTSPLTSFTSPLGDTIPYWNSILGWGYDLWSGGFSGLLSSHSPNATLATQAQSINPNGERNTYTYRIKYGTRVDSMQAANDYLSTVRFHLNLTY
ncbi:hypothetical protein KBD33_00880 [Candidatus Gracilibacteria bacterium]|nr:hypothetical protein [Candidatus Gracilibacteria bacterium]